MSLWSMKIKKRAVEVEQRQGCSVVVVVVIVG